VRINYHGSRSEGVSRNCACWIEDDDKVQFRQTYSSWRSATTEMLLLTSVVAETVVRIGLLHTFE